MPPPCSKNIGTLGWRYGNKERISHEAGNDEAWICLCKNTPSGGGFYPCDEKGNEVEPTEEAWKTGLYVCADCGRMIDFKTLAVMGRNKTLGA
jgi:hypothetical protein